jgi:hypothetical protein
LDHPNATEIAALEYRGEVDFRVVAQIYDHTPTVAVDGAHLGRCIM